MKASLVLVAAATAALLAGAVSAQETPAQPNMSTTAGRDPAAAPQTPPSPGAGAPSGAAPDAQASSSPPAPGSNMPASGPAPTTTANSPAGDAPASYPVCTKAGQDRCRSTGRRGR